jgi:hypothetical protein
MHLKLPPPLDSATAMKLQPEPTAATSDTTSIAGAASLQNCDQLPEHRLSAGRVHAA